MSSPLSISAATRCLIIAPHPDDESLGCGGLIQQTIAAGGKARVVVVTNGEANLWAQRALERKLHINLSARTAWGQRRREEVRSAIQNLGLTETDLSFLDLPDGSLTRQLLRGNTPLADALRREIDAFAPTLMVATSMHDTHADHSATGVVVRLVLRERGGELPALIEYPLHGRVGGGGPSTVYLDLTADQVQKKRAAIGCHKTQTALSGGRFFAFAAPRETFLTSAARDPGHPLTSITRESSGWRIGGGPRRWFDWASRSWIDLLAITAGDIVVRRVVLSSLPGLAARPALLDGRGKIVGRAMRSGRSVLLPENALPPDTQMLFAKRDGGRAFFDEGGWSQWTIDGGTVRAVGST